VSTKALQWLKSALPPAEYAENKGAVWPFRKRRAALEPRDWELLAPVFTVSPTLEEAYNLREDLMELCARD